VSAPGASASGAPAGASPAAPRRARAWLRAGLLALAALVAAAALWQGAARPPPLPLQRAREGAAQPAAGGVQEATLLGRAGEYEPNVIHARAGERLRLRVRAEPHGCTTRFIAPDLGVDVPLSPPETVVEIPAARPGQYLFTCEMRMVKGVLLLE